ncbi:tetratricopeptide repeat protein [Poritiphilus flavus]|uniref:histidine kinase n=1 Tax=Poritiphilus flavus TaxID=2697053 RepID=A0A6L9E7C3_9FLAO|nr:tetratricopeptide repeat protein [Poritiphilus flavus]NAS10590.1 tetratricopeptide repeat protein [Poritiphilus flavus]
MRRLLFLCCLLSSCLMFSQEKEDSLQLELRKAKHDTSRVKILHQLAFTQANTSRDKARESMLKALDIALKTDNDQLKVTSYNHYSNFLRTQSMVDSSVVVSNLALSLAKEINFYKGQATAYSTLGGSYWEKGNFEKSKEYLEKCVALASEIDDKIQIGNAYNVLGAIHTQTIEYTKAMEYYTKAARIFKEAGATRRYILILGNIGFVYRSMDNLDGAERYLLEADSLAKAINDQAARAFSSYNLSIVYRKRGEFDKAIAANLNAISIYKRLGNRKRVAFGQYTMGKIYWEKEEFQQALGYYQQALEISISVDDSVNIGHTHQEIARCFHKLNKNQQAKEHLQKAKAVADGIALDVLSMEVHQSLSQIFAEEGNADAAYTNLLAYTELKDSIYTKEKRELASDIEAKYQNEQKTQEIALLESDKKLQALQLNKRVNERNGIIAFSIVILLLAALLYNQYRVKQKANRKLQELDRLKSSFFANISHEFRTPLTLIQGPIEQLEQHPEEQLSQDTVKMIRRNSNRVLKLVNQLLDLSQIDEGSLKLEPTEGDMFKCLRAACSSFNSHAAQRKIDYRVRIPQTTLWAAFDRDKLEKIAYNLLGNAFKFSEDGATVSFTASYGPPGLEMIVSDTGKGIPQEKLPFVFDRFYQVDGSSTRENEGSGIGLALSRDLVELMDGTITVSSILGKGTTFKIHLPVEEIKSGEDPFIEKPSEYQHEISGSSAFQTGTDERDIPAVLLVEDNTDMRYFIKEQLIKDFKIQEALDGQKGLEIAKAHAPDLVITDLMMPKMDGIELCKRLKTNLHTSHIPVIMLTAKAGQANKIKGLETGADDYLTKPFDAKELLVRTRNLIAQRKKLRERYSGKEKPIDPKEITVTSIDQRFLEQLLKMLEEHYADGAFGVPQMQQALAMSKSQLHRKTKALTDESPGELLRNFRLKRAAQLLAQKADTVTQIAYKVGFNDLSYFTKCFKERYGVVPSSY